LVDILIKDARIVTLNSSRQVIERGSVAIEGERIVAICEEFKDKADKVIDARGKAVLPGLINAHTHLAMVLQRGLADDMPLMEWLSTKVWPIEQRMKDKDCKVGAQLGCLEMIKSGTTCFADQYFNMDQVARVVEESGIRGALSYGMIDNGDSKKREIEVKISQDFIKDFHCKANGRITVMLGPHSPYTCSKECLMEAKEMAKKSSLGIHIHVSESRDELKQVTEKCGKRPLEYLDSIGFLGPEVLAAHCVWINDAEISILRDRGVKPVHNPVSNMKMGVGVAPVPEMLSLGIPVALGTDGAASNNSLDMFREMKAAALLNKVHKMNPVAVPATAALEMATINGAKALSLQDKIGSIEVGKKADLIIIDMEKPHLKPMNNIVSHLIYSANGADVDTTIVDGRVLMEERKVLSLNEEKVLELAQRTSDDLISRLSEKR